MVVVRRRWAQRPRSMPLAIFTVRKELHGFLFLCMHVILCLWLWGSAWRPLGPPELRYHNYSMFRDVPCSWFLSTAADTSSILFHLVVENLILHIFLMIMIIIPCSGMFWDVPECSMFLILLTALLNTLTIRARVRKGNLVNLS